VDIDSVNLDQVPFPKLFSDYPIWAVVHCATNYGRGGSTHLQLWEDNVAFGIRLAEAASNAGVPLFLSVGTQLPKEVSVYALAKAHFAEWGRWIQDRTQFLNLRFEHIYGPGDDEKKFLPWVFSQILARAPEIPLTSGLQQRDFIHVDDAVRAICCVLERAESLCRYDSFDVGSGRVVLVRDLLSMVQRLWPEVSGTSVYTEFRYGAKEYRPHEQMELAEDLSAIRGLGWLPQVDLEDGLRGAIEEYLMREGTL